MKTLFQAIAKSARRATSNMFTNAYRQKSTFQPALRAQVWPKWLHQCVSQEARNDMEKTRQAALLWRNMQELLEFQQETKAMLADLDQRLSDLEAGEGLYLAPKKAALRSGMRPPTGPEIVRMVPDPHPNQ